MSQKIPFQQGGFKGPGLMLTMRAHRRDGIPDRNIPATRLLADLIEAMLALDGITLRGHVEPKGFFNASVYILQLNEADMQRARAVVEQLIKRRPWTAKFWILTIDAEGMALPDQIAPEDLAELEAFAQEIGWGANEAQRVVEQWLMDLEAKLAALENEQRARDGEGWKDGAGA